MRFFSTVAVASAVLASSVLAHPGHDHSKEMAERAAFMKTSKRDLSHCAPQMKARGIEARNVKRRAALAKNLRKKRNLSTSEYIITSLFALLTLVRRSLPQRQRR